MVYLIIAVFLLLNPSFCNSFNIIPGAESIQEAIDMAKAGDLIQIQSGSYQEHIIISKPIILRGLNNGSGMPIIASNDSLNIIEINADGVTFEGFKVISTNTINNVGIQIKSNNTTVKNNIIENNSNYGIRIESCSNNVLENNSISDKDCGISILKGDNNKIIKNNIIKNYIGIEIVISNSTAISNNIIWNNNIGYAYDTYSLILSNIGTNNFKENLQITQEIGEISQIVD